MMGGLCRRIPTISLVRAHPPKGLPLPLAERVYTCAEMPYYLEVLALEDK